MSYFQYLISDDNKVLLADVDQTPIEDFDLYPEKEPETYCKLNVWCNKTENYFVPPEQKMALCINMIS